MIEIELGDLRKIIFSIAEYRGKVYLDLRTWVRYDPRDPGDWKPTRKGVSIPFSRASEFKKAILSFLDEIKICQEARKNEKTKSEGNKAR